MMDDTSVYAPSWPPVGEPSLRYLGRCKRHGCGMAVYEYKGEQFTVSAGVALTRCSFRRSHKV